MKRSLPLKSLHLKKTLLVSTVLLDSNLAVLLQTQHRYSLKTPGLPLARNPSGRGGHLRSPPPARALLLEEGGCAVTLKRVLVVFPLEGSRSQAVPCRQRRGMVTCGLDAPLGDAGAWLSLSSPAAGTRRAPCRQSHVASRTALEGGRAESGFPKEHLGPERALPCLPHPADRSACNKPSAAGPYGCFATSLALYPKGPRIWRA